MKYAIVIPARYESSRFPGKPLAKILRIPLIERVWKQCSMAIEKEKVFVATDSKEIEAFCFDKNINVIMTSKDCLTGSDRVYEAASILGLDYVINVQGDEPLVLPEDINKIIDSSKKHPETILNGMCRIESESEFRSLTVPKVVFNEKKELLYMSRAAIPQNKENSYIKAWKQVCIYGFPIKSLKYFYSQKNKSSNEIIEDIEILRFLDHGFKIKMIEVSQSSIAVDFPEDIQKVEQAIIEQNK